MQGHQGRRVAAPTPNRPASCARRRAWTVAALVALAGASAGGGPAAAELVLLTDGEVFKVDAFVTDGQTARLTLPNGGEIALSALRVDRVLADEIVPEPEIVAAPPAAVPAVAPIALRYDETTQAMPSVPYGELIFDVAKNHKVNPGLVAALIRAESAYDRTAVSHKGARGLMQLMPSTAARFGVEQRELFTPQRNLEAGIKYLSFLIDRYPDKPELVLAAYNAGETAVARYGGVPPYRETRNYVDKIFRFMGATPLS